MINELSGLFGARLSIGIAKQGIALIKRGARIRDAQQVLLDESWSTPIELNAQSLTLTCDALIKAQNCSGLPLHVTLADDLLRFFVVTPPKNVGTVQDLVTMAAVRFQDLYDEPPIDWKLKADWDIKAPFLACAIPCGILNELNGLAKVRRLTLVSVMPQFLRAWNQFRKQLPVGAWMGVLRHDSVTLATSTHDRQLESVRTIAIPEQGHKFGWLHDQMERIALQQGLVMPEQLYLVDNQYGLWSKSPAEIADSPAALSVFNLERKSARATGLNVKVSDALLLAGGAVN
jgi:hypothetical protein